MSGQFRSLAMFVKEMVTFISKHFPKASRILVLVRHGQYNLDGTQDSERYLVPESLYIFLNLPQATSIFLASKRAPALTSEGIFSGTWLSWAKNRLRWLGRGWESCMQDTCRLSKLNDCGATDSISPRNWTRMQTNLQLRSDWWSPLWLGICSLLNKWGENLTVQFFRATETANIILKQVSLIHSTKSQPIFCSCLWRSTRAAVTL